MGNEEDNLATDMDTFYAYIQEMLKQHKEVNPTEKDKVDQAVKISQSQDDKVYSQKYPGIWKYTDVVSELAFRIPSIRMAEAHINAGGKGKTFMYQFNKRAEDNDWIGACHASELAYVFNTNQYQVHIGYPQMKLAKLISGAFASFASNGNPSTQTLEWPEYNATTRPTMLMNDDVTMNVANDPKGEMRELLKGCIHEIGE